MWSTVTLTNLTPGTTYQSGKGLSEIEISKLWSLTEVLDELERQEEEVDPNGAS